MRALTRLERAKIHAEVRAAFIKVRIERNRKWRAENKEKSALSSKRWRERNPEKLKQIVREYHAFNRERRNLKCKEWHKKNPDYARLKGLEFRKKNPNYHKERYRRQKLLKLATTAPDASHVFTG